MIPQRGPFQSIKEAGYHAGLFDALYKGCALMPSGHSVRMKFAKCAKTIPGSSKVVSQRLTHSSEKKPS